MPNVQIDYAQLEQAANDLRRAKEDIEGQLTRLRTMIQNLGQTGFVMDQAGPKFQQSYDQWNNGARNVMGGLEGMTTYLGKVVQVVREGDQQLSQAAGTQ